jgi:hypothetical protein
MDNEKRVRNKKRLQYSLAVIRGSVAVLNFSPAVRFFPGDSEPLRKPSQLQHLNVVRNCGAKIWDE